MGLDPFEITVLLIGVLGAAGLLLMGRPALLSGGRGRLPKSFETSELGPIQLPKDTREPIAYLAESLGRLGFLEADPPVRVHAQTGLWRHLLLVPFIHPEEQALFILGIESVPFANSEMMLHILSPMADRQTVETTTLVGLDELVRPPGTDLSVVIDAESVEEIWSHHRRALTRHERALRRPVTKANWRSHVSTTYDSWLVAALKCNRLTLDSAGEAYRIRPQTERATP